MRALRVLQCDLPHLPAPRQRAGWPAGAHLSREAGPGGSPAEPPDPHPPRPLPHLPGLRDDLSVRSGVRPPRRHRARDRGGADEAVVARGGGPVRDPERLRAPAPRAARPPRRPNRPAPPPARTPAHGASRPARRTAPGRPPPPAHAGALGLRAAGGRAPDQRGRRARLRPARGQPRPGAGGRLLRRHRPPPDRSRPGPRPHAPQHRRVVAVHRERRGGARRHRKRLWGGDPRVRTPAPGRPRLCGEGGAPGLQCT